MSLPSASDFKKLEDISSFGGIELVSRRKHEKSDMKYYRKRIDMRDKHFFSDQEKLTAHVKSLGRTAIYFPVITERKDKKWTVIGVPRDAARASRYLKPSSRR